METVIIGLLAINISRCQLQNETNKHSIILSHGNTEADLDRISSNQDIYMISDNEAKFNLLKGLNELQQMCKSSASEEMFKLIQRMFILDSQFDKAVVYFVRSVTKNFMIQNRQRSVNGLSIEGAVKADADTFEEYIDQILMKKETDAQGILISLIPIVLRINICIVNIFRPQEARKFLNQYTSPDSYFSYLPDISLKADDALNFHERTIYVVRNWRHYDILYCQSSPFYKNILKFKDKDSDLSQQFLKKLSLNDSLLFSKFEVDKEEFKQKSDICSICNKQYVKKDKFEIIKQCSLGTICFLCFQNLIENLDVELPESFLNLLNCYHLIKQSNICTVEHWNDYSNLKHNLLKLKYRSDKQVKKINIILLKVSQNDCSIHQQICNIGLKKTKIMCYQFSDIRCYICHCKEEQTIRGAIFIQIRRLKEESSLIIDYLQRTSMKNSDSFEKSESIFVLYLQYFAKKREIGMNQQNHSSSVEQNCQYYMTIKFQKIYTYTAKNFGILKSEPSLSQFDQLNQNIDSFKMCQIHFCSNCFSFNNLKYCKFGCVSCKKCMSEQQVYCADCLNFIIEVIENKQQGFQSQDQYISFANPSIEQIQLVTEANIIKKQIYGLVYITVVNKEITRSFKKILNLNEKLSTQTFALSPQILEFLNQKKQKSPTDELTDQISILNMMEIELAQKSLVEISNLILCTSCSKKGNLVFYNCKHHLKVLCRSCAEKGSILDLKVCQTCINEIRTCSDKNDENIIQYNFHKSFKFELGDNWLQVKIKENSSLKQKLKVAFITGNKQLFKDIIDKLFSEYLARLNKDPKVLLTKNEKNICYTCNKSLNFQHGRDYFNEEQFCLCDKPFVTNLFSIIQEIIEEAILCSAFIIERQSSLETLDSEEYKSSEKPQVVASSSHGQKTIILKEVKLNGRYMFDYQRIETIIHFAEIIKAFQIEIYDKFQSLNTASQQKDPQILPIQSELSSSYTIPNTIKVDLDLELQSIPNNLNGIEQYIGLCIVKGEAVLILFGLKDGNSHKSLLHYRQELMKVDKIQYAKANRKIEDILKMRKQVGEEIMRLIKSHPKTMMLWFQILGFHLKEELMCAGCLKPISKLQPHLCPNNCMICLKCYRKSKEAICSGCQKKVSE